MAEPRHHPELVPLLVALAFAPAAQAAPGRRLPDDEVRPQRYAITFTPDLAAGTFTGEERIEVRVEKPTRRVVLHAAELTITRAQVRLGTRALAAQVSYDAANEMATLGLPEALPAGAATLELAWKAKLGKTLRGLYAAEAEGHRYAFTQFEATDARRAFPSFDEPAMKARFAITAVIAPADRAISNGAVLSDTVANGRRTVRFAETLPMSSYLVALAVGPLAIADEGRGPVPVRVWSTPGKKHLGVYAREVAEKLLPRFEKYFGVPYPYGKLDLVAVPDFAAGAMENTGAIFFREAGLLIDPKTASAERKRAVSEVIAHEMAHQWFGDLVTMKWWDDLWLNEAFATWMELRILDGTDPDWPVWLDFEAWKQRALEKDALQATHAIRTPVGSPDEAQENFDTITYSKGASGLRMLEAWLGEEPFRAGVSRYLREHQNGNATAEDLWRALGESALPAQAAEVGRVARSWFEQPGLPLVEVSARCEGARTRLDVAQRRFYADGRGQSKQIWRLPLCVRGGDGKTSCTLTTEPSARILLDGCSARPVVNPDHVGFYRVKYDAETLRAHAKNVLSLRPAERIALVSDVQALAEQGALPSSAILDVAMGLRGERNEQVLEALAETLDRLGDNLVGDADRAAFRRFVASIYAPIVRELGWDPRPGEDDRKRLLRKLALLALGVTARDPAVVAEARRRLPAYLDDPAAADGSVGDALVEIAVKSGDAQLVDRLLAARRRAATPEHERRLTYALAAFEDPAAVARALAQLLGSEVRVQDMARLLARFLGNASAQKAAWRFFAENLGRLRDKAPGHAGLERAVDALGNLCDPAARREIASFFADPAHKIDAADRALKEALEQIDECVAWKARGAVEVSRWLMKILNAAG